MTKKISMDGIYTTVLGTPMRILCIDAPGNSPVIAMDREGTIIRYSLYGKNNNIISNWDLTEENWYDDLKVDDKILVGPGRSGPWYRQYFHSVGEEGSILTWPEGKDSWSSGGLTLKPTAWACGMKYEE